MLRSVLCFLAALTGLSFAPVVPALAASFDCSKAATPFERAICADPDLSKADERLAKTYATAIGGLSDDALGRVRNSQREWLDYARRACTVDAVPMTSGDYDESGIRCLRNVFSSRSEVLETSRMIDGIRFYPVASYAALIDPDEVDNPGSNWPVAQHEMALVQIDGDDAFARQFNDLVAAEGEMLAAVLAPMGGPENVAEDGGSDTADKVVVKDVVGRNLITLEVTTYWYGHGAAHGNFTISYRHYLRDQGRFVVAGDMFQGKGWQRALLGLTVEAARAEHGDNLMLDDTQYIAESVIDPSRWDLSSPNGLVIQFQPYEIAAYAYGVPTATVSWDALAPYLTENADRVRRGY